MELLTKKPKYQYVNNVDMEVVQKYKKLVEGYWRNLATKGGAFKGHRFLAFDGHICELMNNEEYWGGFIRWMRFEDAPISVVKEFIGFLTHPRTGEIKQYTFNSTDTAKTPVAALAHKGKGFTIKDEKLNTITTDGDGGFAYPLINGDGKTFHFRTSPETVNGVLKTAWSADGPQEIVYGNVDWKGNGKTLTYSGNPSRYWPVGQFVNIPGLSVTDHAVNSYSYTSVFTSLLYERGNIRAEMPKLYCPLETSEFGEQSATSQGAQVLGAAYRSTDGILLCAVKTCYTTYPRVKAVGEMVSTWQVWTVISPSVLMHDFLEDKTAAEKMVADSQGKYQLVEVPDPGRGYFVEILAEKAGDVIGGWLRLLRIPFDTNMPNCNVFFSEDGTKAVSVMYDHVYQITITGDIATYTKDSAGDFKHTITRTTETSSPDIVPWIDAKAGDWKNHGLAVNRYVQSKSGSKIIAADYKGNELVTMQANLSGTNDYYMEKETGEKWGETAQILDSFDGHENRVPIFVNSTGDPFIDHKTGEVTYCPSGQVRAYCLNICDQLPECFPLPMGNCSKGLPAQGTITMRCTDKVTGLYAERAFTFRSTDGRWVQVGNAVDDAGANPLNGITGFNGWVNASQPWTTRNDPNYGDYNPNDSTPVLFSTRVDPDWETINHNPLCTEFTFTRYYFTHNAYPYGDDLMCSYPTSVFDACTKPRASCKTTCNYNNCCTQCDFIVTQVYTYKWVC